MEAVYVESQRFYSTLNQQISASFVLQCGAIFCAVWFMYAFLIKPFLSPLRKIPGLHYIPFVGNMNEALKGQAMEATTKWLKKYGTLVRYYFFFGTERLVVAEPEIMKHIMVINSKNYIKPTSRLLILRKIAGHQSLLLTEGPTHTAQRKLMNPAFKYSSIKDMVKSFDRNGHKLCARWRHAARNNTVTQEPAEVQVETDLPRLTLDIIGECGFSYDFDSLDNPDSEISTAFHRILCGIGLSWKHIIPFYEYMPTEENRRFMRELSLIRKTVLDMIQKKKTLLSSRIGDGVSSGVRDLLEMLMLAQDEDGEGMSDACLQDQVVTFMLAGHETTSTAMSWALLLLAQHPDIQKRVRDEAQQVLPPTGEQITWDHLDNLKYLTCVIKETLRFCPPVPMTLREAVHDDKFGKYSIPAGTIILLAIGPMMRLPQYFSDPDDFKPERFLDETSESTATLYRFLPFLMGPRMCIGYKFALAEMKTVLAILVRDLSFSTIPGVEHKRKFRGTMKPNPPLVLRVSAVGEE